MSIEWLGKCSLMISEARISVDPVVTVSSIRTSNAFSGMRCFIFFSYFHAACGICLSSKSPLFQLTSLVAPSEVSSLLLRESLVRE